MSNDMLVGDMKINPNIPGWNDPYILGIIAGYAASIPENGHILELGALFGRTTYVLGHNKKPTVTLTTIDHWKSFNCTEILCHDGKCGEAELALLKSKMHGDKLTLDGQDFFGLWKYFTTGIYNLTPIVSNVSDVPVFEAGIDFIYHDAGHSYDEVFCDLSHWLPVLKKTGIAIVDDFDWDNFPGVCEAVLEICKIYNLSFEKVGNRNIILKFL